MFHVTYYDKAGQVFTFAPWDNEPLVFYELDTAIEWAVDTNLAFVVKDDAGKIVFMSESFGE